MLKFAEAPKNYYQSVHLFSELATRGLLTDPKFPEVIPGMLERADFSPLPKGPHPLHHTRIDILKAISSLHALGFLKQPSAKALQNVKQLILDSHSGLLYPFAQEDCEMLVHLITAWDLAKDEPALKAFFNPP